MRWPAVGTGAGAGAGAGAATVPAAGVTATAALVLAGGSMVMRKLRVTPPSTTVHWVVTGPLNAAGAAAGAGGRSEVGAGAGGGREDGGGSLQAEEGRALALGAAPRRLFLLLMLEKSSPPS